MSSGFSIRIPGGRTVLTAPTETMGMKMTGTTFRHVGTQAHRLRTPHVPLLVHGSGRLKQGYGSIPGTPLIEPVHGQHPPRTGPILHHQGGASSQVSVQVAGIEAAFDVRKDLQPRCRPPKVSVLFW